MDSMKGLWAVVISGVVLTSAVYLVLNAKSGAIGTLSQGVAGSLQSLGNTARGQ